MASHGKKPRSGRLRRRALLATAVAIIGGLAVWALEGEPDSKKILQRLGIKSSEDHEGMVKEIQEKLDDLLKSCGAQQGRLERILEARSPELFIQLESKAGEIRSVDILGERTVGFHFYATYCVPCEKEYPHIAALLNKEAADHYSLVMVSQDLKDSRNFVELQEHLVDRLGETAAAKVLLVRDDCKFQQALMGGECEMPQTAVLSPVGMVTARETGPSEELWTSGSFGD